MKRSRFFVIAAAVPGLFGMVMMLVPDVMLGNSLVVETDAATRLVTRWVGFAVFSLACITFLSRHDVGSPALRAVTVGNILFHALGCGFDVYGHAVGLMTTSGLISGVLPHSLLAIGFIYYLVRMRDGGGAAAATGRLQPFPP